MTEIKYEKVKENLKKLIKTGKYKSGDKLPTESELMKKYNVSRYTIRRAAGELENEHYIYRIQGGGMYVDDWKKKKKRALVNTKMIGIVTTHLADYIFPRIISGIDKVLSENGYSLILSNTHNNPEEERKALQRMIDNQVSGIIIEPTQSALDNPNMDIYKKIEEDGIPAMLINAHYPNLNLPYLEVDDRKAEQEMTNYLIKMGHKRILGMFQVDDMQGVNRMRGFFDAYMQHPEISYLSENIMYQSAENMSPIFGKVVSALQSENHPTAIVCYNDALAIQMMDVIRSVDLRIPEDISIVGFDNYILGRYINPKLTTVDHPKEKMGIDAAKMIIKMVNHEEVDSKEYDLKLIFNQSVKELS